MIFAREVSDPLTSLVKKIDSATAKNSDAKMGSFVVFLDDNPDLEPKLKDLAKKEQLDQVVLCIDNPAGPQRYKIAKDADVTVVLYVHSEVKANHAFKKGELHDKHVDQVVADLAKILPAKEKK